MKRSALTTILAVLVGCATPALGHPAPFSYIDVRLAQEAVDVSLIVHVFDVAHDLGIAPQERLLDPAFLAAQDSAIATLLGPRFQLATDGTPLMPVSWAAVEALPDRQAVRLRARYLFHGAPGTLAIRARMFPYDPAHQTFVNVYEGDTLALQAILDPGTNTLDYYPGSSQGTLALVERFVPVGFRHVLFGADHLVFLLGLLLLGGSARRIATMAGAFSCASIAAILLTVLHVLQPAARIIEPAVALGIIYVGADNLLVRDGRDMRAWIALGFGFVHGFWFANGLRAMDLPAGTLKWSLIAFEAGTVAAEALMLVVVGAAIGALWLRHGAAARRVAAIGSALVIVGGVYWFALRVFFPGGLG